MITVNLKAGLGNQLFQYAFGRSLAHDLNTDLFFDLSHYDTDYSKSIIHDCYNLHHFKINENYLKFSNDKKSLSNLNFYDESLFNKITDFPSRNFNKLQIPAHFDGYWQSEKYFMHNEKIIRKDLQFKNTLNGKDKVVAKDITSHNAVAMHIRRGDYLDYTKFGTCSTDYYKKAVSFIEEHVENPKFFIFSDDHQWVKKNIHISHPTYHVTHNDVEKGHKDLRLMSLCKHFIIANSSFSWWGAWLSENEDKIVTTPQPWFICRHPNLRYIDKGENYFPIPNDHSKVFNDSKIILFNLNDSKYLDISSVNNTDLSFDKNILNIKTSGNDSKIYLKEIQRLNENNDVIMKISMEAKSSGVLEVYYTTKQSANHTGYNKFYSYYYENDDLDIYIYLTKEFLLTNLMLVPSSIGETEINIKSLEIREISNSKKYYSSAYKTVSNKISKFRNVFAGLNKKS